MADNFGLKIGIDGEKEFKNSLRDINQSFKVLGSEMKLVSSEFDKNDKSIQAVSARNAVLNKSIDAQKEKISTLEKMISEPKTGQFNSITLRLSSKVWSENLRLMRRQSIQWGDSSAD